MKRRNFIKNSALALGAVSCPSAVMSNSNKEAKPKPVKLPYKNTYVKNNFVAENEFRISKNYDLSIPDFEKSKSKLPKPFWSGHKEAIDMYWFAWKIAFQNIRKASVHSGFISTYIDTAYNGNLFMWDSAFITMFARYGDRAFPFQKTLDNFYTKQHLDGFICREIKGSTGEDCFHRYDPVSTGPNIIPWSELEYYLQFGDWDRLNQVFPVLCAYNRWLKLNRTWRNGLYWSSGWGTGMDNQPRVPKGYNMIYSHGHMVWVDACLQQLFVAKILMDMGFYLERWQEIEDIEDEQGFLEKEIKKQLWDDKTGFFYDQFADNSLSTMKSIGAFWALHSNLLNKSEMDSFVNHLKDETSFKRPYMVPSLPHSHERYQEDGRYWQGGVWCPTNFMIIKGLKKNGYNKEAFDISLNHHNQVLEVFKKTGTLWEYYAPEKAEQGLMARPDFVGWAGLPPISVLIEGIFGIEINYLKKTLSWDVNLLEEHGIENLPFGKTGLISLKCLARKSKSEEPKFEIKSNENLKLVYRWEGKETVLQVNSE
jgi:hypothetical protein